MPKKVLIAAEAAYKKKAENIIILDVKEAATFTNYFLICQGNSEPQIEAITESVEEELSAKKYFPHHIEGKKELQWVLMDYDDLIVHVFLPEVRAYYELEKLWGNSQKFNYEDLISRRISKCIWSVFSKGKERY